MGTENQTFLTADKQLLMQEGTGDRQQFLGSVEENQSAATDDIKRSSFVSVAALKQGALLIEEEDHNMETQPHHDESSTASDLT